MAGGFKTAQVTVATTANGTLLAAARPGRHAVTIINHGTTIVYVGDLGLTTSTGAYLAGVAGASITIPADTAVYGIVGTGTQAVSVLETF